MDNLKQKLIDKREGLIDLQQQKSNNIQELNNLKQRNKELDNKLKKIDEKIKNIPADVKLQKLNYVYYKYIIIVCPILTILLSRNCIYAIKEAIYGTFAFNLVFAVLFSAAGFFGHRATKKDIKNFKQLKIDAEKEKEELEKEKQLIKEEYNLNNEKIEELDSRNEELITEIYNVLISLSNDEQIKNNIIKELVQIAPKDFELNAYTEEMTTVEVTPKSIQKIKK